jgi:hypothetical protein
MSGDYVVGAWLNFRQGRSLLGPSGTMDHGGEMHVGGPRGAVAEDDLDLELVELIG